MKKKIKKKFSKSSLLTRIKISDKREYFWRVFCSKEFSEFKNKNITSACLEYGIRRGCLAEKMKLNPITNYTTAKNNLRLFY